MNDNEPPHIDLTEEQWDAIERSERIIKDFLRLAYQVKCAVNALEYAYIGLTNCPDDTRIAMPTLVKSANVIFEDVRYWMDNFDADFDPSKDPSEDQ